MSGEMSGEPSDGVPAVDEAAFLGGLLHLIQPRDGHRAGTDAVVLAAAMPENFSGMACDVGAGVGAAGLAVAALNPAAQIALVEIDPFVAGLARENLARTDFSERGRVYEADVVSAASRRAAGLRDAFAEIVLTNPPFLDPDRARVSPYADKQRAHAMPPGPDALAAWLRACLALLAPGGLFAMIHKPEALAGILPAFEGRVGEVTLMPVQPRDGQAAVRLLIRARKGSRAPLRIAPALVLHDGDRFTPFVEALHRGEGRIAWDT